MAIINDVVLPQEVMEELHATIERMPAEALVDLAMREGSFAPGIRAIPANAPKLRERMRALADSPARMPQGALATLRVNSFYQSFTCVLSTLALVQGFEAIAQFTGGARLLVAMLLDTRKEVADKAAAVIRSGSPIAPPPRSAEDARKAMQDTFAPFLDEMSGILLAPEPPPPPKPAKPAPESRPCDIALIRELKESNAKLERKAATLQHKVDAERERSAAAHKAKLDSEKAASSARAEMSAALAANEALKAEAATIRTHLEKALADAESAREAKAAAHQRLNTAKAKLADVEAAAAELKRKLAAAKSRIAELEQNAATTARDEFAREIEKSMPHAPAAARPRTMLSEFLQRPVAAHEKFVFLVDGHNVLNTARRYVVDVENGVPHEDLRKALMKDAAALQRKLAPCEMRVFFDGSNPAEHTMPGNADVKEIYSGGTGEHRADKRIAAYCVFLEMHNGARAIVVTDDAELRDEAGKSSALLLHTADFAALL